MTTPIQGNPFNLQGNGQPLQGGAAVLQGSSQQVQGTPTVAPASAAIVNKAVQKPTATPGPAPQTFSFMNEQVKYDPVTGQAVSIPSAPTAPTTPAATQLTPEQQLAGQAGSAGLSTTDLSNLFGLTSAERQQIYDNLGLTTLASSIFSSPSKTSQQIYNDAYTAAGLGDLRTKMAELAAQIKDKTGTLNTELGTVNENPWLSEASRSGRAKRLQEVAQGDIKNIIDQYNNLETLYTQGLNEVHNVVTMANNDFQANQNLNNAKLGYLERQASQQASDAVNSKIARYMPDYLKAKIADQPAKTLTAGDGSTYTWDSAQGKFKQLTGPKSLTVGKSSTIYDPDSGEFITVPGGGSGLGAGGANLSSSTLTKVQTVANQFDNEQIVKDYNVISGKYESVKNIIGSGVGGPGDLAVVYEFMKGLDPSSVVRETEYASAAKSGNIFAGTFARFNGYLKEKGGFLPDAVKQAFLSILSTKLQTVQRQYHNVYSEYGRRINKLTGNTDGTDYITNYGQAFSGSSGTNAADVDSLLSKYGLN